jgi:hypothetical protein
MTNTYVFEILETLNHEELDALARFLASPFFNVSSTAEKHILLLQAYRQSKNSKDDSQFKREAIYQFVYRDEKFIEGKIDKLLTEFKKLLNSYLTINQFNKQFSEEKQSIFLLSFFRQKNIEKRYFQTLDKLNSRLDISDSIEEMAFNLDVAQEVHEWHNTYNKAKGDLKLPELIRHLDKYYYAQKTELLSKLLQQKRLTILPEGTLNNTFDNWKVPLEYQNESKVILISSKIFDLLNSDSITVKDFENLLLLLKTHESAISPSKLTEFYTYIRNFCNYLIDFKMQYDMKLVHHQIQKDNLERGYFYFDGKISSNGFISIIQRALDVNAIEWADKFIESHKHIIIGENADQEFYRTAKAMYFFAEKKFDEAIGILPFGSSYTYYHLIARRLELKIYYELDSDLLLYKIDSFKMFIIRAGKKDLPKSRAEFYVNFVNFVRQLYLSPRIKDKKRAEQMQKRINGKAQVAERAWLLDKASELGERKP